MMRWYFMQYLACPVCKASGDKLLLHPIETDKAGPPRKLEEIRCKNYCHYLRRPASEVTLEVCKECSRLVVKTGVIVCLSCGRWYPIIDGIPRMQDDEYRDIKTYRRFIRKYIGLIPENIRAYMKIPSLEELLENNGREEPG